MTNTQAAEALPPKPLRLWPGVVAAVLLWLVRFGVPLVVPGFEGFRVALLGGFVGVLAIIVWWAFLSRAHRFERWGAIALIVLALAATWRVNHESLGLVWCLGYAIPILSLALVAWAVASRHLAAGARRPALVATIVLVSGVWALLRTDGMAGDHTSDFSWRWTKTPEQRLLARFADEPTALQAAGAAADAVVHWPGFRGHGRDGVVPGVRIETAWSASPPVELWRRPIGPGWSSFAIQGELLYTQEQRGEYETVSCYDLTSGEPVWEHRDAARFYESMGGVGPRATPTLSNGRLYTLGATGILNALEPDNGAVVWSRNLAFDSDARMPIWGFASSPLVVDDLVIVAVAGRLNAYDVATGATRWSGPVGGVSYSSPHLAMLDGVEQILWLNEAGATSVTPSDGTILWQNSWQGQALVQPALTGDGDVLISAGEGRGVRRLSIGHDSDEWTADERWTSERLKPNFNDFVVHGKHAFGFDGRMLACIDLHDGERKWKGGRYGHGQLVLLPDQDLLLVLSEEGELALVEASTKKFSELARFPAIEGKTWNHPALVGDLLLVRNSRELAVFQLSPDEP